MSEFTSRQKSDCAEREARYRDRVYSRMVEEGRMKPETAKQQIAMMIEIAAEYREKADAEEAEGRLL